jgi:hypothetical protein
MANRTMVQMMPLSLMIGTISAFKQRGHRENRRSFGFGPTDISATDLCFVIPAAKRSGYMRSLQPSLIPCQILIQFHVPFPKSLTSLDKSTFLVCSGVAFRNRRSI